MYCGESPSGKGQEVSQVPPSLEALRISEAELENWRINPRTGKEPEPGGEWFFG
jgi:hypothetical protein